MVRTSFQIILSRASHLTRLQTSSTASRTNRLGSRRIDLGSISRIQQGSSPCSRRPGSRRRALCLVTMGNSTPPTSSSPTATLERRTRSNHRDLTLVQTSRVRDSIFRARTSRPLGLASRVRISKSLASAFKDKASRTPALACKGRISGTRASIATIRCSRQPASACSRVKISRRLASSQRETTSSPVRITASLKQIAFSSLSNRQGKRLAFLATINSSKVPSAPSSSPRDNLPKRHFSAKSRNNSQTRQISSSSHKSLSSQLEMREVNLGPNFSELNLHLGEFNPSKASL